MNGLSHMCVRAIPALTEQTRNPKTRRVPRERENEGTNRIFAPAAQRQKVSQMKKPIRSATSSLVVTTVLESARPANKKKFRNEPNTELSNLPARTKNEGTNRIPGPSVERQRVSQMEELVPGAANPLVAATELNFGIRTLKPECAHPSARERWRNEPKWRCRTLSRKTKMNERTEFSRPRVLSGTSQPFRFQYRHTRGVPH